MQFPDDVDGDVLRRLEEAGFDFSKSCTVDFNIDFENWPPPKEALDELRGTFGTIEVYGPEDSYEGYVLITIESFISYEFVVRTQTYVTQLMSKYGGVCESWGVLH